MWESCPLVHSPDAHQHGWTYGKLRADKSVRVSHMDGSTLVLVPSPAVTKVHINRNLDLEVNLGPKLRLLNMRYSYVNGVITTLSIATPCL